MTRALLPALALLLAAPAAAEPDADALFQRGSQAYLHGDYQAAIDAYEQVIALGVIHEDLEYNLGNAYFRADRLGPAILHYERALTIEPSQEDAEANLRLAREAARVRFQDRLQGSEKEPLWMRLVAPLPLGLLSLGFFALYWGCFGLAFLVYLLHRGFLRLATTVVLVFVVLVTALCATALGSRYYLDRRVQRAIVLPDELAVKEGPDASSQTSFLIHAGMRLRVAGHDGDWVRIRLQNGLEGWARDRDLGRL